MFNWHTEHGFCSIQVKSLNDQCSWCFRQRPVSPPYISCPQIRLLVLVHKYLGNLVLPVAAHLFIDDVPEAHRQQQGCCNLIKIPSTFLFAHVIAQEPFPFFVPTCFSGRAENGTILSVHSFLVQSADWTSAANTELWPTSRKSPLQHLDTDI